MNYHPLNEMSPEYSGYTTDEGHQGYWAHPAPGIPIQQMGYPASQVPPQHPGYPTGQIGLEYMGYHGGETSADYMWNQTGAMQPGFGGYPTGEAATGYPGKQEFGIEQDHGALAVTQNTFLELPKWRQHTLVVSLALMMMFLGYDSSNFADIQVAIYTAFGNIQLMPWALASFSLGSASLGPLMKRLMYAFDLKWFYTASLFVAAVGGIVSGAAQDMRSIIAGRLVLGFGVAGAYLSMVTMIKMITTPVQLAKINGLAGAGFAVGMLLGPLIGATISENEHATWRWASYIIAPWVVVVSGFGLISYPSIRLSAKAGLAQKLLEIDYVGALLHAATLVLFNAACLFSGTTWEWNSGPCIAIWVVMVIVTIAYALQQYFCWFTSPANRIFPVSVIGCRVGFLCFVGTNCAAATYAIVLFYSPLYYAFARGDSARQVVVRLLPFLCLYILFSLLSGMLLPRVKVYAAFFLVSGLLITAGAGGIMTIDAQTPTTTLMGLAALIGAGVGTTFQLAISVLPIALPADRRSEFVLAVHQSQYIAITMGISLAGCIYQNQGFNRLRAALENSGFSDQDIRESLAGLKATILVGQDQQITALATSILIDVIVKLFYLVLAAGILMVLVSFRMKWEKLDFRTEAEKTQDLAENDAQA